MLPTAGHADFVTVPVVANAMAGSSTSGNNQVWMRAIGQPAGVPSSCVYAGRSLFYLPSGAELDGDKALSILISAQISKTPVQIAYTVVGTTSDFGGFGITNCRIDRLSLGD